LACQSMTHELDIETPGKQLLQLAQLDCGRFILAFCKQAANGTMQAARKCDQAIAVAGKGAKCQLRRLARFALEERLAYQAQQIEVARLTLHQEDELIRRQAKSGAAGPVRALAPEAELAADDGLNARLGRRLGKLERAE